MRTAIVALAVAASALGGCTFNSTTVERERTPAHVAVEPGPAPAPVVVYQAQEPLVYQAPPTAVYQAPPTPVYQAQTPAVSAPPSGTVAVNYTGPNGYQLARQKAGQYCVAHYGNTRISLITNDDTAGRATFGCYRI